MQPGLQPGQCSVRVAAAAEPPEAAVAVAVVGVVGAEEALLGAGAVVVSVVEAETERLREQWPLRLKLQQWLLLIVSLLLYRSSDMLVVVRLWCSVRSVGLTIHRL